MTIIGLWLYKIYPMSTDLTYKHPFKEWLIESLLYMVPFGTTTLLWLLNLVTDHDNGPIDSAFVLISQMMQFAPLGTLIGGFYASASYGSEL